MIVSFFHHGKVSNETGGRSGGGGIVKNYLLGTKENPRAGAKLILGNADDTTEIINSIKNSKIYTSGVLSFSKEENVTDENKFKIIQSFTDTLFPDFEQDRVSGYWVEHRDKERLELHFVFADIDLLTGKALPVYYHGKDLGLVDNWKNITNYEYGLIDPNDPKHKRLLAPTSDKDLKKQDTKKSDWDRKEEIHNWLLNEIEQNAHIQSRADIIKHLEKSGYEVTRASKKDNTISIKNPDGGRNLKLKGALYDPKFDRNYSLEQATADYQASQKKRIEQQYAEYEIELDRRKSRLQKRFGTIDRRPLDNALTRELDEIRINATNSFIETTNQFINEHDLSAKQRHERIVDSLEQAKTVKSGAYAILETANGAEQAIDENTIQAKNNTSRIKTNTERAEANTRRIDLRRQLFDYNTTRINELKQLNKQREIDEQQEQLRQAEQERNQRQEQEIELNRTAFERSIMPHVQQHFKDTRQAKIEFDYDLSNYSLYRAVKATTAMQTSVEMGDSEQFKNSFIAYKNATLGEKAETDHSRLNKLAETGKIGIFEKFRQRDINSYIHYEWNKPLHLQLKQQALNLVQAINERVVQLVEFAKKHSIITENDGLNMNMFDKNKVTPFSEINSDIDSKLDYHQKDVNQNVAKLTNTRTHSNGHNKP